MDFDWRGRVILTKLAAGCIVRESGNSAGITKPTILKRRGASPELAQTVTAARGPGKEERIFRLWLRDPFRGNRAPTGKGNGSKDKAQGLELETALRADLV